MWPCRRGRALEHMAGDAKRAAVVACRRRLPKRHQCGHASCCLFAFCCFHVLEQRFTRPWYHEGGAVHVWRFVRPAASGSSEQWGMCWEAFSIRVEIDPS